MKIGDLRITLDARAIQAMIDFSRAVDQAGRALSRLRYPPKAPARGSVSRRREKLKKARILR